MMLRFARWHIWLGWVVGLPILMWTVTGLVMVARPIEEVRGSALQAPAVPVAPGAYTLPEMDEPIHHAELIQQPIGPVWLVTTTDGGRYRYYAPDGSLVPPVIESEAREIAEASFADGTNLYIDAATGEVLALRTGWWRIYDFMWGLHIMDPATREDTHNPFVIAFAVLATFGALLGCILLFRRRKAGPRR